MLGNNSRVCGHWSRPNLVRNVGGLAVRGDGDDGKQLRHEAFLSLLSGDVHIIFSPELDKVVRKHESEVGGSCLVITHPFCHSRACASRNSGSCIFLHLLALVHTVRHHLGDVDHLTPRP